MYLVRSSLGKWAAVGMRQIQIDAARQSLVSAASSQVTKKHDRLGKSKIQPQRSYADHDSGLPTISDYYAGKNVFITGGTGFCGKPIIEKLLRSCPKVKGIYCLIRPKTGQTPDMRVKELLADPLFDTLKSIDNEHSFVHKVHPVEGDICYDGFGIDAKVQEHLNRNVNIVIHSAATINFNDPLNMAVNMNVLGTRRAVELARRLDQLDSLVHVSTAYAYANRCSKEVKEDVYEPSIDYKHLIELCKTTPQDELQKLRNGIVADYPNTYSFTKGVTEYMLMQEARDLPLSIVRPSVVTCTYKDPFSGWIDKNANTGLTSLFYWIGRGSLRIVRANPQTTIDIVPVDLVANSIIASSWLRSVQPTNSPQIYNVTSGELNPVKAGKYMDMAARIYREVPMDRCVKAPAQRWMTTSPAVYHFKNMFDNWLPCIYRDAVRLCTGKKARWSKLAYMNMKMSDGLAYFQENEFYFESTNFQRLINSMTQQDANTFWCDPRDVDYEELFALKALGIKRYIAGETLPGRVGNMCNADGEEADTQLAGLLHGGGI